MANLINKNFFVGEIDLPGRTQTGTDEILDLMISRYGVEFLQKSLGFEMWKEFEANKTQASGIWYDLIHGKEYTVNEKLYKWAGLIDSDLFISPIAYYVYWQYRKATYTLTGNVGENKPKAENADVVSPDYKMVNAWNRMADMVRQMYHFLNNNTGTYPLWNTGYCSLLTQKTNVFGI